MPDLKSLENLYLVMGFIVPGLVMTYVRAQFITGRTKALTESVLAFLALSLLYYGPVLPLSNMSSNSPAGCCSYLHGSASSL